MDHDPWGKFWWPGPGFEPARPSAFQSESELGIGVFVFYFCFFYNWLG